MYFMMDLFLFLNFHALAFPIKVGRRADLVAP